MIKCSISDNKHEIRKMYQKWAINREYQ